MPILGVGTDILFVPRIAVLILRRPAERLASRILCEREYKHWLSLQTSPERSRFLAVRWSVKEAAYKALQPDFHITWKKLSFLKDPESTSSKPVLCVMQGVLPGVRLHASVSHDGDYVIAMVIAELLASVDGHQAS